jgi:hypothetical protein
MSDLLPRGVFPSQAVSDEYKSSIEYGTEVAQAIEGEWFRRDSGSVRYFANRDNFHRLRLYARGEQSIQKYKDELSINGDLSYLNLDWKNVPIIPKFVDIVVNGMSNRAYDVKAYAQDPASVKKKTDYVESLVNDMQNRELLETVEAEFGVSMFKNNREDIPFSMEELELKMQLDYKDSIEVAEETLINNIYSQNKYELTERRLLYDLAVLGIACNKTTFNTADGAKIEYVDPADIVYSYTEDPYFSDLYYVGEVKRTTISELKKQYPGLTEEDVKEIEGLNSNTLLYNKSYGSIDSSDNNYVYVLYFEYKTFRHEVHKIKKTASGADKAIKKDDKFNPPKDTRSLFTREARAEEVLYRGAKIVGLNKMLDWSLAENMVRPKSETNRVHMSYNIVAPRVYKGKVDSLVNRMTTFADMIQLTHLKMQQVMSRIVPDGVYLDADGIAEIDLGNGTNYTPEEALNMYFQTGSVIGRSMTQDGEFNHGRVPIQELQSSNGGAKMASLINNYNFNLQMIRDVTGLNEARDGSMPDSNALVGLQKLAAANSNTATRHILQSCLHLSLRAAENVSLIASDILEFSTLSDSLIRSIGQINAGVLNEIKDLYLHDFGIFLELAPDEEEKQLLENNIQVALSRDQIFLEDAIDIRDVKNIKLANQLLKLKRKNKMAQDRLTQLENIQAQSQSNAQAAQAAAAADMQKQQAITESKVQLNRAQMEFDITKLEREAEIKKQLMMHEFELNMKLKDADLQVINNKEAYKEDRKDKRTKIQATQQSQLIEQRQKSTPPKNFESAGFDVLGGFGLEQFEPK